MSDSNSTGCSIPIPMILGVVFITLKLTHRIDWSWWWVLSPFWIGYAIMAVVMFLFFGGLTGLIGAIGLADFFSSRRK